MTDASPLAGLLETGALESAAKALWEVWPERAHARWDQRRNVMKDETRKEARAVIIAYLSDEALIEKATKAVARLQDNDMRDEPGADEIASAVLAVLLAGLQP